MTPKGRLRGASEQGEDAQTILSTSQPGRRYAVEQAIARARSAHPWHEVSSDCLCKPLSQCMVDEEVGTGVDEQEPGDD